MGNDNIDFHANSPSPFIPPEGSTEESTINKETTGGVKHSDKQRQVAKGTVDVNVQFDAFDVTGNIKGSLTNNDGMGFDPKNPPPPDQPKIPSPNRFNSEGVEFGEWFASTYMVDMATSYTAIAMLNKEIHKAEGAWLVRQLAYIWKEAQAIAELIMAKAEKEAAMHMALAIAAVASLAVSVVGMGLAWKGRSMQTQAENKIAAIDAGKTPETPNPTTSASAGAHATIGPRTPAQQEAALANFGRRLENPDMPKPPPKLQSRSADQTKPSHTDTPDPKIDARAKLNEKVGKGSTLYMIGSAMTQMTPSVGQIFENLIQMFFKPEIAYIEQQIELARASKDLGSKALDSAIQGFTQAGQEIDASQQAWQKQQDENTRAHHLGPN